MPRPEPSDPVSVGPRSLIALSMHKAGSSVTQQILAEFARAAGYRRDIISHRFSTSHLSEADLFLTYQSQMQLNGVYYGVARGPYVRDMEIISALKVVVQLRDPRDCLTSAYFSFSQSHRRPTDPGKRREFDARWNRVSAMRIDDYVLQEAPGYADRLRILSDILATHDDALVLTYEEMVTDTPAWLGRISDFLQQPVTGRLANVLERKADFTAPDKEDPASHRRQVTPGDYRRKLKPATITALNAVLRDGMERFGYAP